MRMKGSLHSYRRPGVESFPNAASLASSHMDSLTPGRSGYAEARSRDFSAREKLTPMESIEEVIPQPGFERGFRSCTEEQQTGVLHGAAPCCTAPKHERVRKLVVRAACRGFPR
jgi:hypothetical protein